MPVDHKQIDLKTEGHTDIIDVTDQIKEELKSSGIDDGSLCVFHPGSTGAVTTIEYESGCVKDFEELFERLIPADRSYHHEAGLPESNAHSHLRASIIGPSVSLPIRDGQLVHGTWQQIVFVDFDNRPRNRTLELQITGE